MLRLTLGPPQQLVDNYNAQLGVTVTKNEVNNGLSRSASITSNGDCSMSSGCMSEADEENAFDVEYPDGGTIRRKPTAAGTLQPLPVLLGDTLPLPPPAAFSDLENLQIIGKAKESVQRLLIYVCFSKIEEVQQS